MQRRLNWVVKVISAFKWETLRRHTHALHLPCKLIIQSKNVLHKRCCVATIKVYNIEFKTVSQYMWQYMRKKLIKDVNELGVLEIRQRQMPQLTQCAQIKENDYKFNNWPQIHRMKFTTSQCE